MNIWIVTTGSSDVQLKTDEYWSDWYERSSVKQNCYRLPFKPIQIIEDSDEPYRVGSRVLGRVYKEQPEEVWEYLEFPLLHQFTTQLQIDKIDKIILLVTDQTIFFNEERREERRCAYWQDTCELQPIIERYFKEQEEFRDVELIPIVLSPGENTPGLDDWNHVLKIVRIKFSEILTEAKVVYVSHQAGTPAISSAVQFMSLARFGERVQFLVSNEYENKPLDPIDSSEYLRGIQVQQAKGLIKSGTPGAALQLLELEGIKADIDNKAIEDLEKLVDFFNLNRSLAAGASEFDIEPATQRIVDAVTLIEKLFEQENYLQGIALLASAQETFLKCAIKNEIKGRKVSLSIDGTSQDFKADDLIKWMREGLKFITNNELESRWSVSGSTKKEISRAINNLKRETLNELQFPVDDERFIGKYSGDPNTIEKNEFLLKWLCKLRIDFNPWQLLQGSCIDKNEDGKYEDDIRNKLMHNLQGVKKEEVVKYLLGNRDSPNTEVIDAYNTHVKPQFLEAIHLCGLPFTEQKLAERLQDVADAISVKSS
ncbi:MULTISPECIES: hypothetical protein [unclassified Microcoleus]|uniref:hypothetical protein n=1 Tax=unclassified Microcoleus TaxID=2642155 RepID=UPI002FD06338